MHQQKLEKEILADLPRQMKRRIKINPTGYVGLFLMVLGTFGDNLFNVNHQFIDYASFALVIIGFTLAYGGIERRKPK